MLTTINFNNKNSKTLFQSLIKFTGTKHIPITGYFKFYIKDGKLFVTASDLETFVSVELTPDIASLTSDSIKLFCIDAEDFLDAISSTDDFTHFTLSVHNGGDKITASTPDYTQNINSVPADDYPNTPGPTKDIRTEHIPVDHLYQILPTALKFVAKEELRPQLTGINFNFSEASNSVVICATDAYTLYKNIISGLRNINGDTSTKGGLESFIMPQLFAKKLINVLSYCSKYNKEMKYNSDNFTVLKFNKINIEFKYGNFTIVGRQMDARYPNYNSVIPTDNMITWKLDISSQLFLDSLKKVSGKSNPNTKKVDLDINLGGEMKLYACDIDTNKEAKKVITDCKVECIESSVDNQFGISLNSSYIEKVIKESMNDGDIEVLFSDPSRAILIKQKSQPGLSTICIPFMR